MTHCCMLPFWVKIGPDRCVTEEPPNREDQDAISRRLHIPQLSRRRLFDLYFRGLVLVDDHHLQRPVQASGHVRLGETDLGDRADHISLSGHLRLPDYTKPGLGRATEPADATSPRRYAPLRRLQRRR